jgi:hypothetical protein
LPGQVLPFRAFLRYQKNYYKFFRPDFAKIGFFSVVIIEGEIYPNPGREARRPFSVSKSSRKGSAAVMECHARFTARLSDKANPAPSIHAVIEGIAPLSFRLERRQTHDPKT